MQMTYSTVDILDGLRRREGSRELSGSWNWDDIRAVDKFASGLAKDSHLRHGGLEVVHHCLVVIYDAIGSATYIRLKKIVLYVLTRDCHSQAALSDTTTTLRRVIGA